MKTIALLCKTLGVTGGESSPLTVSESEREPLREHSPSRRKLGGMADSWSLTRLWQVDRDPESTRNDRITAGYLNVIAGTVTIIGYAACYGIHLYRGYYCGDMIWPVLSFVINAGLQYWVAVTAGLLRIALTLSARRVYYRELHRVAGQSWLWTGFINLAYAVDQLSVFGGVSTVLVDNITLNRIHCWCVKIGTVAAVGKFCFMPVIYYALSRGNARHTPRYRQRFRVRVAFFIVAECLVVMLAGLLDLGPCAFRHYQRPVTLAEARHRVFPYVHPNIVSHIVSHPEVKPYAWERTDGLDLADSYERYHPKLFRKCLPGEETLCVVTTFSAYDTGCWRSTAFAFAETFMLTLILILEVVEGLELLEDDLEAHEE